MPKPNLMPNEGSYSAFLDDLKQRIRSAQVRAALAVNRELVLLYWQIGQEIISRQKTEGWGSKVIQRLAEDLKREFPDIKGFSRTNLLYMRSFAEAWPDEQNVHQLGGQIPWRHNCTILDKVKDPQERRWYIQQTIEHGWSRSILVTQLESGLYQREGGAVTNFERTLPPPQSELAQQVIKDPYNFDFLTIAKDARTKDLKRALIAHMRDFLLELGVGFAFVRKNYRIDIGGEEFQIDMLFYHLQLRCFIVIQLEMGSFRPEQSGVMNFYLSAIDEQERLPGDQPTIGIILCKTKDRTIAEYSLRNLKNPIAVAEHRFSEVLPSSEQLKSELDTAARLLGAEGKDDG